MGLLKNLTNLQKIGCYPCISYRGAGIWRAHINGAGNHWAEASDPNEALSLAITEWESAGRPMDGYAAIEQC